MGKKVLIVFGGKKYYNKKGNEMKNKTKVTNLIMKNLQKKKITDSRIKKEAKNGCMFEIPIHIRDQFLLS